MTTPAYLYLITNRDPAGNFGDSMAPDGALTYADAATDGDNPPTTFEFSDKATIKARMVADLSALATSGAVNLMVFIHGFDTTWPEIQCLGGKWMTSLRTTGRYHGVQVIFDWPSGHDAFDFYGAMNRARETATESLGKLVSFLNEVTGDPTLQSVTVSLQLLCHSMGNYVFQQGADHFPDRSISQTSLVAAMLDYTAFNTSSPTKTQGAAVSAASTQVNCYYSSNDDVLGLTFMAGWLHQLGKDGPWSYTDSLASGFVGLNCSAVVNTTNEKASGAKQTHTAYFYIAETLMDMAASLMGEPSPFRTPIHGTNQGFTLSDLMTVNQQAETGD
jgi:esterase/lipase superfamily enzyme